MQFALAFPLHGYEKSLFNLDIQITAKPFNTTFFNNSDYTVSSHNSSAHISADTFDPKRSSKCHKIRFLRLRLPNWNFTGDYSYAILLHSSTDRDLQQHFLSRILELTTTPSHDHSRSLPRSETSSQSLKLSIFFSSSAF